MIAIPNVDKPKFCEDCFVPLSKCEYFAKNGIDHCPIIEIDESDEIAKYIYAVYGERRSE